MTRFLGVLVLLLGFADTAHSQARSSSHSEIHLATIGANFRVALNEIARKYEELHPDVRVRITVVPQQYETWIRTRFAGGGDQVPDIYNVNYTIGYESQGRLVFLDEYLNDINPYTGERWIDGLDEPLINRYKWAGKIFSIPLDFVDIGIFYNKEIFDEVGVEIPETWEEFMEVCEAIKQAGFVPVAMAADAEAFWTSSLGWLVRLLGDAYIRDLVPVVISKPGDWDYDPDRNEGYEYDPDDPYSDLYVAFNRERLLKAIEDNIIDFSGDKFRAIYRQLENFSKYWQSGFMGTDMASAMQMFYRQRAAMMLQTSALVTAIERDFARLHPNDRFEYGVFWFPPITEDPLVEGPFRGVGGGANMFGIVQKHDIEHTERVIDFMRFLTSPESGRILVERTLEEEQPLNGPMSILNVDLPDNIAEKYAPFVGHGFEKLNFRGLEDEQESVAEWVVIAQEFLGGRMSMDEFLDGYKELMLRAIPRVREMYGMDGDPTTPEQPPRLGEVTINTWHWNPFVNGIFAVMIILTLFASYAMVQIMRSTGQIRQQTITAYILLFPTFFLLGTFMYFPAISGLYHAFTRWEPGSAAEFNGLENFRRLWQDEFFWSGITNMIILTIAGLIKATVVPFIAVQLILGLRNDRFKYLFRTSFLVPMVVPGMVAILIWRFIYDPNAGMLNQALEAVGLEQWTRTWLGEPHLALPSIIFMGFPWIGALGLLIYMAGLINVPQSVYEAYRLESDSILRRIFSIDIPMVRGQTRLLVVLTFIGSLQDFQTILIMTGGGPGLATMVPALRMYHAAFRFNHFGYGAAIGFVLFLAILIITIINMKVLKPAEDDS